MNPQPRALRPPRRHRRGFSLLELMVSLTVGGLAISAMYAIGSAVTRQYHQQYQAANAMTTLRVALNQVKRDIARAGYLSTPAGWPNAPHSTPTCSMTTDVTFDNANGSLAGISNAADNVCITGSACNNLIPECTGCNTANPGNGFTADSIVLMGNYETAAEYSGLQMINAGEVSIGRSSHAYQTDFTTWYGSGLNFDANAFARVFAPQRLIRIRTTTGRLHFAQVTGVSNQTGTSDARVTFSPQVPAGCLGGLDGAWIAPVSTIRYYPRNDPDTPTDPADAVWGPMVQLVREEVLPTDKSTRLPITEPTDTNYTYFNTRVVLDYLVAFNLGYVMTASTCVGCADSFTAGNDGASAATVNGAPERVRAVTIELAARTPEQDRSFPFSAVCAGLGCYQAFSNRPGASRVRTLRAEVFVPNIAFEGY